MSRITTGWLARHTPQGPGGRQAALIDIAQDLLLARLCEREVFDHLVFKGGTALRKPVLSASSRSSTSALDNYLRQPAQQPALGGQLQPADPRVLGQLAQQLLISRRHPRPVRP